MFGAVGFTPQPYRVDVQLISHNAGRMLPSDFLFARLEHRLTYACFPGRISIFICFQLLRSDSE